MYTKHYRAVGMDAGTTLKKFAERIRGLRFPYEGCSQLTVLTNSPGILNELYPNEGIRTIIVGGEIRRDRYSIVGHFAERAIDAFDIVTDIAIVGATGVDLDRGFTSDDVRETSMKLRLLNSRVRCVALDSTKVELSNATMSVFADFNSEQIDFVLMNDFVRKKGELLDTFCTKLDTAGILLLTPSTIIGTLRGGPSYAPGGRKAANSVVASKPRRGAAKSGTNE